MLRRRSISSQRASKVSDAIRISFFSCCLLILNNESPGRNKSTGALFFLPAAVLRRETAERTLFHYFSINIDHFFTSHRLISRDRRINPSLPRSQNLLIINNFLFYDCFNSCFAFDGYNYYTCRSRDLSFVGCNYCVGNSLTKYIRDYYVLTSCTLNSYYTVTSDNAD